MLTGALLAGVKNYIVEALTLQDGFELIGIGMWLALIMAANVWFIIWPNQKRALGPGRGRRCQQGQVGADRDGRLADQHHAVDPDALRDDDLPDARQLNACGEPQAAGC